MTSSHSLHPTASLSTLPTEVLTLVISYLDRNSAVKLARVAKQFTPIADRGIYRELDLSLRPTYGQRPLVQPYTASDEKPYQEWAKIAAHEAEEEHRAGLRAKVRGIVVRGGERRLGMVEKITVVSRPGAVNPILSLLEIVSPNLRHLVLDAPADHPFASTWRPADYDTLDVRLIGYGLYFPVLTHLHIKLNSIRFGETILLLCQACPSLVWLEVDMDQDQGAALWDPHEEMVPMPPTTGDFSTLPEIRHLAFTCRDRWNEAELVDFHPLILIAQNSPELRDLSMQYVSEGYDSVLVDILMNYIPEHAYLEHLVWSISPEEYGRCLGQEEGIFPALTALTLTSNSDLDLLVYLPPLPEVETITIVRPHIGSSLTPPPPTEFPEPSPCYSMLPDFATSLRASPRLHTINSVTSIGGDAPPNGVVRSFIHGEQELLHAHLFLDHFEIADLAADDPFPEGIVIVYTAANGASRKRVYERRAEAAWQAHTDFEGRAVPLEVFHKMRLAQGMTVQQWRGRGVEVEEAAWQILVDWREKTDGQHKAQEA